MTTGKTYYGINSEITDSYRRTLVFNNTLLIEQFDRRYDFNTDQAVLKRRRVGESEDRIQKYVAVRDRDKEKRKAAYIKRLIASVEPAVNAYAHNIKMFISGSGEESYI